jgi:hypothetical protein
MLKKRRAFSLNYLFASFFGAAMIAAAFAYFNFRFSEYKFIDFSQWIFYEKKDIFKPIYDKYTVLLYSSNQSNLKEALKKFNTKNHLLIVDIYQQRLPKTKNITYITSGTNTLLKLIQRFNIYEVPSVFEIQKHKNSKYKQNSSIMTF